MLLLCNPVYAGPKKNSEYVKVVREKTVLASWYNHGKVTANGERFNPRNLTAAHKTLPFGTIVRFTNPENNKVIFVRINDRGPFIRGRDFDLTEHAAALLGIKGKGVAKLKAYIL
jgi:rare lipoprotein A